MPMKYSPSEEKELMLQVFRMQDNLEDLIMFLYPWGGKGTPLERFPNGPKKWQRKVIRKLNRRILDNKRRIAMGKPPKTLQLARVSGRGIGKSALFGMLTHTLLSIVPGMTIQISANTEAQMISKTMPEIKKWSTLAINAHWFETSTTAVVPAPWFAKMVREDLGIDTGYYYAKTASWSEEEPDAYAGAHSTIGMMLIFDEASGIPKPIWTVAKGFFTDLTPYRFWIAFSNGRNNTGSFFECFNANRKFWDGEGINALDVEDIDHTVHREIIEENGEDSDEARVEVYGRFPKQGEKQFIPSGLVVEATEREVMDDSGAPILIGVDVARFGSDDSVIAIRQGRSATKWPWSRYSGRDTMELVHEVIEIADKLDPDMIFVDGGGVGGGVVDRLKELRYRVTDVQFGSRSSDKNRHMNKRCEIWDAMKDWLERGSIPRIENDRLKDDLTNPTYRFVGDSSALRLETKEEMKKRGLPSPDWGDALALTFAEKVARRDARVRRGRGRQRDQAEGVDYSLFA